MLYKQTFVALAAAVLVVGATECSAASEPAFAASAAIAADTGFYGGIALRENAQDAGGINLGRLSSAWAKFVAPTADESGSRTLMFGGYRWNTDLAVEASLGTATTTYMLALPGRRGVGLSLESVNDNGAARSWNADVYTSWAFRRRFALYGRLGFAQSDIVTPYTALPSIDGRRTRDGVNYGVGLRYDVTPALGLRLEYARFTRFAGENIAGFLPENDQVQFGMQFRF